MRAWWFGVVISLAAGGCVKEYVIQKKTAQAYATATPLVSRAPLAPGAPVPEVFSYEALDRLLSRFVDGQGRVNYQVLAKDRADLDAFAALVNAYSPQSHPQLFPTREAEMAYYVNAFNVSTLLLVLHRYPIANIYEMRAEFFIGTVFVLGGKKYTLHDLEGMLLTTYRDPRVHFALNCAARSDPRLPQQAFHAENFEEELEREARFWVSEARNVRPRPEGTVELSMMLDLYQDDFLDFERAQGEKAPSLLHFLNRHRAPEEQLDESARVKFVPYNWTPNDQAVP